MNWQVSPLSRKCAKSGESFEPGEHVVCFVYQGDEGELERCDVKEGLLGDFEVPANVIARWTREVKERGSEEDKLAKQESLQSAEELFLSLFGDAEEEGEHDREILKQILALYLERKRVVRRKKVSGEIAMYIHVKSKNEYEVSLKGFDMEEISKMEKQLQTLIL